jgi:hypothetical protein
MEVFIVTEHVEWEGYSIVAVFLYEEGARLDVWNRVAYNLKYNEEDGNVVQTQGFHETHPIFVMGRSRGGNLVHRDGVEQWFQIRKFHVYDDTMPGRV